MQDKVSQPDHTYIHIPKTYNGNNRGLDAEARQTISHARTQRTNLLGKPLPDSSAKLKREGQHSTVPHSGHGALILAISSVVP